MAIVRSSALPVSYRSDTAAAPLSPVVAQATSAGTRWWYWTTATPSRMACS